MPMRDFSLKREEKELSPETLYQILYRMWGNERALKKFKEITGKEYEGQTIKEPDWFDMFNNEVTDNEP